MRVAPRWTSSCCSRARPTPLVGCENVCPASAMASPGTQASADGPSGSGDSEASRPAGAQAQDERVEVLQSGLSFRSGDCDGHETAVSNRFRSNIEIVEKPRQMIVLVATIVGASYLVSFTFSQTHAHASANPRVYTAIPKIASGRHRRRACVPQLAVRFKPLSLPSRRNEYSLVLLLSDIFGCLCFARSAQRVVTAVPSQNVNVRKFSKGRACSTSSRWSRLCCTS